MLLFIGREDSKEHKFSKIVTPILTNRNNRKQGASLILISGEKGRQVQLLLFIGREDSKENKFSKIVTPQI